MSRVHFSEELSAQQVSPLGEFAYIPQYLERRTAHLDIKGDEAETGGALERTTVSAGGLWFNCRLGSEAFVGAGVGLDGVWTAAPHVPAQWFWLPLEGLALHAPCQCEF